MGVMDVVKKIAEKQGLSDEELDGLLAEGDSPEIDFTEPLPGEASDILEVFLSETSEMLEDKEGLIWAPMIRAGQFAMRPGPRGEKIKRPLKIIAGKSEDPLKELGLQDLVEAFNDDAVDYVTVPTSHDNKTLENTGFIRKMKIMDAPVTTGPNKGKKTATLFGAYEFTEPDVKQKIKNGTIPGRSCGILYNYFNTETAKQYPSVIEHVALTPKPWIRGMMAFGRKLAESVQTIGLSLSDEDPETDPIGDVSAELADPFASSGSETTVTWTHEDSPNWLRQQINDILRAARSEKLRARSGSNNFLEDRVPYYSCVEAKSESADGGRALVSDGYSDGSNYWVAPFKIDDGTVELDDFGSWDAVKSVYISDDRDAPETGKEPLDEEQPRELTAGDRLELAHAERRVRSGEWDKDRLDLLVDSMTASTTTTHPRGGDQMAKENGNGDSVQTLSEEAEARVKAAEERAQAAENQATKLAEQVSRLTSTGQSNDVKEFIGELKAMGLDEEHGFSGALVELENILLADDLEPAVVSEKFSDDGSTEVPLTLTESFRRVFGAIKKGEDGKVSLGEALEQPSNTETPDGEAPAAGTQASEPAAPVDPGKPAAESSQTELSSEGAEERAQKLAEGNPAMAAVTGLGKKDDKKEEVKS